MISQKQIDEMTAIRLEMQTLLQRIDSWMTSVTSVTQSTTPSVPVVSATPVITAPHPAVMTPAKAPAPAPVPRPVSQATATPSASLHSPTFHSSYSELLNSKSGDDNKAPEPVKVTSGTMNTVRAAAINVLAQSPKPLSFNDIYAKLLEMKNVLPPDKPMLILRKILFDKACFIVVSGGLYKNAPTTIVPSAMSVPQSTAQAAPVPPQAPAPHNFTKTLNNILGQ